MHATDLALRAAADAALALADAIRAANDAAAAAGHNAALDRRTVDAALAAADALRAAFADRTTGRPFEAAIAENLDAAVAHLRNARVELDARANARRARIDAACPECGTDRRRDPFCCPSGRTISRLPGGVPRGPRPE